MEPRRSMASIIVEAPENGKLSTRPEKEAGVGSVVKIVYSAGETYRLSDLSVSGAEVKWDEQLGYYFLMPEGGVTVSAGYEKIPNATITFDETQGVVKSYTLASFDGSIGQYKLDPRAKEGDPHTVEDLVPGKYIYFLVLPKEGYVLDKVTLLFEGKEKSEDITEALFQNRNLINAYEYEQGVTSFELTATFKPAKKITVPELDPGTGELNIYGNYPTNYAAPGDLVAFDYKIADGYRVKNFTINGAEVTPKNNYNAEAKVWFFEMPNADVEMKMALEKPNQHYLYVSADPSGIKGAIVCPFANKKVMVGEKVQFNLSIVEGYENPTLQMIGFDVDDVEQKVNAEKNIIEYEFVMPDNVVVIDADYKEKPSTATP